MESTCARAFESLHLTFSAAVCQTINRPAIYPCERHDITRAILLTPAIPMALQNHVKNDVYRAHFKVQFESGLHDEQRAYYQLDTRL